MHKKGPLEADGGCEMPDEGPKTAKMAVWRPMMGLKERNEARKRPEMADESPMSDFGGSRRPQNARKWPLRAR